MRLAKRTALVTGGASGIGKAIVERFAREGAQIAVVDRNGGAAAEVAAAIVAEGGRAVAIPADVSQPQQVSAMTERVFEAFGAVDILVNNAGAARGDDIVTMSAEDWEFNHQVVLNSVFLCSKSLLPAMIEQQHGVIVNIGSVNGLTGFGEEGYSAAKAGMVSLTQNMAVKYGRFGVRANCICPATIRTPIWQPQLEHEPDVFERLAAWYPLGRVGEPEDVAHAALFLASDEAAWISGTTLVVDGGLLAGNYRMTNELLAGSSNHTTE